MLVIAVPTEARGIRSPWSCSDSSRGAGKRLRSPAGAVPALTPGATSPADSYYQCPVYRAVLSNIFVRGRSGATKLNKIMGLFFFLNGYLQNLSLFPKNAYCV